MKYKIGFLTYKKLDILVRESIDKLDDLNIEVTLIEGLMENLTDKVNEFVKNGIEVFIGGGANLEVVMQTTSATVMPIKLTMLDYIEALQQAKKIGNKIAMVHFKSTNMQNFKMLEKLLEVEIQIILFQDVEELENLLSKANVDVVIGASLSNEVAQKLGIASVLIYPGEDTILSSIKDAKLMAKTLRQEREKSKIMQSILEFSPNGIIAIDKAGKIILYNPAAEKIMSVSNKKAKGENIKIVFPEFDLTKTLESKNAEIGIIDRINDDEVIIHKLPIEVEGDVISAIAIICPASELQKAERHIHISNTKKGFSSKHHFTNIIGNSHIIKDKVKEAKMFAKSNANLLIYGETGVGKEIFAQSIHNYSLKSTGPFVAINCAALPENLLESELFGYDEGAFTGSKKGGKAGLFEIANEGTIFLDEISELSPVLQTRLLRVIQEREVMRLGGDRVIPIKVRIVAATNVNLEKKISHGFRNDLFYRLSVLQLNIPSLRERQKDVVDLFIYFLNKHVNMERYKIEIPKKSLDILTLYSWPGNIRELENVVERFAIIFQNIHRVDEFAFINTLVKAIGEERLFEDIFKKYNFSLENKVENRNIPKQLIHDLEKIFPSKKVVIAERLGISRTTLWRIANS